MLDIFEPNSTLIALFSLSVVFVMFIGFVRETYPTEVIAISGVSVLLFTGVLPYRDALNVLSNPAPWTIGAMFIIMGALVRTGALDKFTQIAQKSAKTNPNLAIALLIVFVVVSSAFVSNTPVVVVMIPVFIQLAKQLNKSASKFLIPLSYAAILGGTLTLIGTSTNLLVDGVATAQGLKPFSIFEVTPVAIVLVVWGLIYLRFIAPRLLPNRVSMATLLSDRSSKKFFTEVVIPPNSDLIDCAVTSVQSFKREGVRLVDVVRGDYSLRRHLGDVVLQVGDRIILRTQVSELLSMQNDKNLIRVDPVSAVETTTVEVLITPDCKMVGRTLGALRLRRRFGVYTLAVHRHDKNIGTQLDDLYVRVGDTLLLEGAPDDIQRLAQEMRLGDVSQPTERAYRRQKAPIVIFSLAAIVILAAFGVAPIFLLSLLAMAIILLTNCIDADEAFSFVEGRLLALIFAMLAIGVALENSGAVSLIVTSISPLFSYLPPILALWFVYLLTSLLTEMVSNNAVAVVITPIAIGLAEGLGYDPRAFVVAIMIAASASFATPIGYQTNTMVYGPGGYKFSDFLKVGIPLNLSIGIVSVLTIPLFFSL